MRVRASAGKVPTLLRSFERHMRLALQDDQVALGTRNAIWFLRNAADIAPQIEPRDTHDACFVPRQGTWRPDSNLTAGNEIEIGRNEISVGARAARPP